MNRRVVIVDDSLYDIDSADNSTSYDMIHRVPSRAFASTKTQRGIRLCGPSGQIASCLVIFQGTTPLRPSSVTIHDDHLYVTAGESLCAIDLSDLHMNWHVDLLSGAANGVYISSTHSCVLAVGDFDMTCIGQSGDVRWATNVVDFLTPNVTIDGHDIAVVDDRGNRHVLNIDTGTKVVG